MAVDLAEGIEDLLPGDITPTDATIAALSIGLLLDLGDYESIVEALAQGSDIDPEVGALNGWLEHPDVVAIHPAHLPRILFVVLGRLALLIAATDNLPPLGLIEEAVHRVTPAIQIGQVA